ncbi:MAG: ribulose-phosphate 3-epimerase, partial [Geminicoccaceae bacterium]
VPVLRRIRAAGCRAAMALNPPTPLSAITPYLDELDDVLVMSVMPGFGGQSFEASVLDKVRALRAARPRLPISIDGGINPGTAALAVHLDVMDGHFVPNLSYGAPVIADWRPRTDLPFDAHLMISDPARYLDDFVAAGCDVVIVQIEAVPEPSGLLRRIRDAGCRASLALNPPTPLAAIEPYLDEVDAVLVMSVMPGFGGQAFEPSVLDKVRAARAARPDLRISIDGGIKPDTAAEAAAAGVSQLVAGSAVFRRDGNYAAALAELADGARRGSERGGGSAPKAESPALE